MYQMKREQCDYPAELVAFYLLCKSNVDAESVSADLVPAFEDSLKKNRFKTAQVMLWSCDNRFGLGNDNIILALLPKFLETDDINVPFKLRIIKSLIHMSKWNIVVKVLNFKTKSRIRNFIFNEAKSALKYNSINCAKFMPRKGAIANRIRGFMKLSPTEWRKLIVPICNDQLTTLMSSRQWNKIDYSKLPTHVLVENYNALRRHDKVRFTKYLEDTPARAFTIDKILNNERPKIISSLGDVLHMNSYLLTARKFR